MKIKFLIFAAVAATLAPTVNAGNPITYTDWTTASSAGVNANVHGSLFLSSGIINVTYTGEFSFAQINNNGTQFWTQPDSSSLPYTGNSVVGNAPSTTDIIALSEPNGVEVNTITFSRPVYNPIMLVNSLGNPGLTVKYVFNQSFILLSAGSGYFGGTSTSLTKSGDTLAGDEGAGAIEFLGEVRSITWHAGGTYGSEYWNGFTIGAETSQPVPPSIVLQPTSIATNQGDDVTFIVEATGTAPLAYQWLFDGTNMPGATSPMVTLTDVQPDQVGSYSVIVANMAGSVTSSNAILTMINSTQPNPLATVNMGVIQWNLWGGTPGRWPPPGTPGLTNGPGAKGVNTVNNVCTAENDPPELFPIINGAGNFTYGSSFTYFTNILEGPNSVRDAVLGDGYCDQFIGVFIPPVSTNYTFFLCSDDVSQLYLSSDITEANKQLIAEENRWSGADEWTTSDGGSTLSLKRSDQFVARGKTAPQYPNGIPMVAGGMYFIELLHENGTGSYNDSATYKFAKASDPANGDDTIIGANNLAYVVQPPTYFSATVTPTNRTVYAGSEAAFSVSIESDETGYPAAYQWQKNGVNITNADGSAANGQIYTTIVSTNDNNASFQCVVSYPAVTTNFYSSAPATITVLPGTLINGGLQREYWSDEGWLPGILSGVIEAPDYTTNVTSFECPVDTGIGNYDQRVSGWFIPSTTGRYVFFIESDNFSDLFIRVCLRIHFG